MPYEIDYRPLYIMVFLFILFLIVYLRLWRFGKRHAGVYPEQLRGHLLDFPTGLGRQKSRIVNIDERFEPPIIELEDFEDKIRIPIQYIKFKNKAATLTGDEDLAEAYTDFDPFTHTWIGEPFNEEAVKEANVDRVKKFSQEYLTHLQNQRYLDLGDAKRRILIDADMYGDLQDAFTIQVVKGKGKGLPEEEGGGIAG